MARPPKLTAEVQRRIQEALRCGNTRRDAALYAGVGVTTFYHWIGKGRRQRRGQYRTFLNAVKKAETEAIVSSVAVVRRAAHEHWQAAAWFLERRRPGDWGQQRDRIKKIEQDLLEIKGHVTVIGARAASSPAGANGGAGDARAR